MKRIFVLSIACAAMFIAIFAVARNANAVEIGPTPQPPQPQWMYVLDDINKDGVKDKISFLSRDVYIFGSVFLGDDVPGSYWGDYVGLLAPRYIVESSADSIDTTLLDYYITDTDTATLISGTGGILTTLWESDHIRLTRIVDLSLQRCLMTFTIENIGLMTLQNVRFTEEHTFDDYHYEFNGDIMIGGQIIGKNYYWTEDYPVFGIVYAPIPEYMDVKPKSSEAIFYLGELQPNEAKSIKLSIVWSNSDISSLAEQQVIEKMVAQKLELRTIKVPIDIKPGSCPNPLNINSKGVLPVAILGTEDFDITTIDPSTIRLSREGIEEGVAPICWSYEDVATPFEGELCDCHDLNGDGYMDLSLKFDTPELVDKLKLNEVAGETIPLIITGNLKEENGGTPIQGKDCVWVLKQGK